MMKMYQLNTIGTSVVDPDGWGDDAGEATAYDIRMFTMRR